MIRIAIPTFQHRVSPVLDTCTRLLIFEFENKVEIDRREIALDRYTQPERFEILKKISPHAVICCGISDVFDKMLQSTGIPLVCGIIGDVDEVAQAFICGRIDSPCFRMPGSLQS